MATVTITTYTCDNCDKVMEGEDEAQTFRITYNHATHSVDLCAECATKVAWLHAKGTPVRTVGRPSKTTGTAAKRGRPRKATPPVVTENAPDAPITEPGAKVMTLGELVEGMDSPGMEVVPMTGDDGMGGTITAVPQPAFASPASDA